MALAGTYCLRGLPIENGNLQFPQIDKPKIVGFYSIDSNRDYKDTAENISYFRMPTKFPLDLNEGLGLANTSKGCVQTELLEHILQFISRQDLLNLDLPYGRAVNNIDFICYRGLLRLVMGTPYEPTEEWSILVSRFKGNTYLFEHETDSNKKSKDERPGLHKIFAYGFKFEQYCLTPNPLEDPDTSVPVDECKNFNIVYETNFSGMKVLYAAEVDGAISKEETAKKKIKNIDDLKALQLMELKSCIRPKHGKQEQFYKDKKCRNWWCQSFLVGIKDLILGYRNSEGFVDEVKHIDIRTLPQIAEGLWSQSECAHFLIKFLHKIQAIMKDTDCPHTVYEFYFNPKSRIISYRIHNGKSAFTFLPDWYIQKLQ